MAQTVVHWSNKDRGSDFMDLIIPDQKVYKAAKLFADGEAIDEVKEILSECLSDNIVDQVIDDIQNAYKDDDFGYSALLEAVNKALGQYVYSAEE